MQEREQKTTTNLEDDKSRCNKGHSLANIDQLVSQLNKVVQDRVRLDVVDNRLTLLSNNLVGKRDTRLNARRSDGNVCLGGNHSLDTPVDHFGELRSVGTVPEGFDVALDVFEI